MTYEKEYVVHSYTQYPGRPVVLGMFEDDVNMMAASGYRLQCFQMSDTNDTIVAVFRREPDWPEYKQFLNWKRQRTITAEYEKPAEGG